MGLVLSHTIVSLFLYYRNRDRHAHLLDVADQTSFPERLGDQVRQYESCICRGHWPCIVFYTLYTIEKECPLQGQNSSGLQILYFVCVYDICHFIISHSIYGIVCWKFSFSCRLLYFLEPTHVVYLFKQNNDKKIVENSLLKDMNSYIIMSLLRIHIKWLHFLQI